MTTQLKTFCEIQNKETGIQYKLHWICCYSMVPPIYFPTVKWSNTIMSILLMLLPPWARCDNEGEQDAYNKVIFK